MATTLTESISHRKYSREPSDLVSARNSSKHDRFKYQLYPSHLFPVLNYEFYSLKLFRLMLLTRQEQWLKLILNPSNDSKNPLLIVLLDVPIFCGFEFIVVLAALPCSEYHHFLHFPPVRSFSLSKIQKYFEIILQQLL